MNSPNIATLPTRHPPRPHSPTRPMTLLWTQTHPPMTQYTTMPTISPLEKNSRTSKTPPTTGDHDQDATMNDTSATNNTAPDTHHDEAANHDSDTITFHAPGSPNGPKDTRPTDRIFYTDSEWISDPWTAVISKSRKNKTKKSQSSDDDNSRTSFEDILNKLHTPTQAPKILSQAQD